MNPLATELNEIIQKDSPQVLAMLSNLGKELFMPKGILTQGAQAKEKAYKFNATIGIATEGKEPMYLDCLYEKFNSMAPKDLFTYAPTTGKPELRKAWQEKMLKENPSLQGKSFGTPIATNALTHGLSIVSDLFCDEGDYIVMPDKFWGNYRLTFCTRRGGILTTFPTFNDKNEFNVDGLLKKVSECGKLRPKVILVLNFPNNPTGYTITVSEAEALAKGLKELADSGIKIVAVMDDAYFGMFYEDSIKESFFSNLVSVSKNLLPIKLDGATKEMFVWGFRVGFITFGSPKDTVDGSMLKALEQKVSGCIRGTISSGPHMAQSLLLETLKDPRWEDQQAAKIEILHKRATKSKEILKQERFKDQFTLYPFNSGYFLTLQIKHVDAEKLRLHLLDKYGVGTVSTSATDLRVAFSSMEENDLVELFDIIYQGCKDLA